MMMMMMMMMIRKILLPFPHFQLYVTDFILLFTYNFIQEFSYVLILHHVKKKVPNPHIRKWPWFFRTVEPRGKKERKKGRKEEKKERIRVWNTQTICKKASKQ
jgi:hypothetical protein